MRRLGVLLGTVAVAAALLGCGGGSGSGAGLDEAVAEFERGGEDRPSEPGAVSKEEFGGRWPLTVSHGTLSCDGSGGVGAAVFTAPDGHRYALNGVALQEGLSEIEPIWRYQPGMEKYELRVNMGPLLDRGLALCE